MIARPQLGIILLFFGESSHQPPLPLHLKKNRDNDNAEKWPRSRISIQAGYNVALSSALLLYFFAAASLVLVVVFGDLILEFYFLIYRLCSWPFCNSLRVLPAVNG